ncbi:anti-sigma factor [Caulobacter sp. DWR1-3-2b1]|uniref:anti-sigma factor n=1 Tax=Caulobacter sp. DWR1-3-2b1 TaxID=2804670 RepID=UPI003CF624B6
MTDITAPEEERPLAGEYVLGVLDAAERVQVQARIAAEPGFARAVQWWENHLTPLAADIKGVEPSAGLWPRIANLIGEATKPSLWNNTRVWRGVSVGAVALAAASVAALVMTPRAPPVPAVAPTPTPAAAEVALINDPTTSQTALVATLDHATNQLILTPVSMKMPSQRDAELWIIPEGQKPISLGVIPQDAPARIVVPAGLRGVGTYTATLAVTDEPLGGSPSGDPTGSVRAAGKFAKA